MSTTAASSSSSSMATSSSSNMTQRQGYEGSGVRASGVVLPAAGEGPRSERRQHIEELESQLYDPVARFSELSPAAIARARARARRMARPQEKLLRPGDPVMPKVIVYTHRCIKFVYIALYALALWMLFSMRSTFLYANPRHTSELNQDAVSVLALSVLASLTALFILQGSNPGYLTTAHARKYAPREMRSLMHGDGGDGSDGDEDNGEGSGASRGGEGSGAGAGAGQSVVVSSNLMGDRLRAPSPARVEPSHVVRAGEGKEEDEEGGDQLAFPLRSHYCRVCERRVATYDHHCFVIGTCIGEKNHCRFWWFLFFQSISLCLAITSTNSSYEYERTWSDWVSHNAIPLMGDFIFWLLLAFVGGLWIFHSWLMCTNGTTHELSKGPRKLDYLEGTRECDLPFSRGLIGNLRSFCCVRDGAWGAIGRNWRPTRWKPPGRINRDSDDVFENMWENKYYSCC